jgi:hypothetical protein
MKLRKATALSTILVLVFITLSIVWLSFTDLSPLTSPARISAELPGTVGYSVYQLSDGSLILNTTNQTCTFLIKLDSQNQLLWERPIQTNTVNTTLPRLLPTADGGFVLAGIINNLYIIVKTDSQGNINWTKALNSGAPINYFMSIIQTSDNGFAIAGFGEPVEDGLGWIWLAKTDASGIVEWTKNISGPLADCPSSIFQTSDGGYVLSDVSYSFEPNHAFFRLITTDPNGNVLNFKVFGGYDYYYQPECNLAIMTKDGGYLMAGYLWEKSAWIVKTDAQGDQMWNQTYGAKHSSITSAVETPNGYLLLSISNLTDVGLILTDTRGNQVWTTSFPNVRLPVGLEANFNSLIQTKDKGYLVVGSKDNSVWLAKLNVQQNELLLPTIAIFMLTAAAAMTIIDRAKRKAEKSKELKKINSKRERI